MLFPSVVNLTFDKNIQDGSEDYKISIEHLLMFFLQIGTLLDPATIRQEIRRAC